MAESVASEKVLQPRAVFNLRLDMVAYLRNCC